MADECTEGATDQTATTGQQHSHGLMQKLQRKHLDAIATFQTQVREMCSQLDSDEFKVLGELRTTLMMSRTRCEDLVFAEAQRISDHRTFLEQTKEVFLNRPSGAEVQLLQDDIHQDGLKSIVTREKRIVYRRTQVLQLAEQLHKCHKERMAHIEGCEEWLRDCENKRKGKLKAMLEKLLGELTTIAYANTTETQLLVQRAVTATNSELLANQMTCVSLISQLKQHELLKQREIAQRMAQLYQDNQEVIANSIRLWTMQYLCSPLFRAPQSRVAILMKVTDTYSLTKKEVESLIGGMSRHADSLIRKRENAAIVELPGGTEEVGWLRHFEEGKQTPPFVTSPTTVAEEWKVSIEVILHHVQCLNATVLADTERSEHQLYRDVEETHNVLLQQLEMLFTPTEEEYDLVQQSSLSPDNVYPFQVVMVNEPQYTKLQKEASESLHPIKEAIHEESSWFVQTLASKLYIANARVVTLLATGNGNVIHLFHDASVALEMTATPPTHAIRNFYVLQIEMQKDYEDQLRWYEESYADIEDKIIHAGTIRSATEYCQQAMDVLANIENLYRKNHVNHMDSMAPMRVELTETFKNLTTDLFEKLGVISLSEVEEFNAKVDEMREKEKQAQKAERGAKGKQPPKTAEILTTSETVIPARINVETMPKVTLPNGVVYVVRQERLKFGFNAELEEQRRKEEEAAAEQQAQSPVSNKGAPEPEKKEKGGKGKSGGKKGEVVEVVEAVPESRPVTPRAQTKQLFEKRMLDLMEPVFFQECLIADQSINNLSGNIRCRMLQWLEDLKTVSFKSVDDYCANAKEELDEVSNDLVRHHQRRAPTLQAKIYEVRIRTLEDNAQTRAKYMTWLHQRVGQASEHMTTEMAAAEASMSAEMDNLQTSRKSLVGIISMSALETHTRTFAEQLKNVRATDEKKLEAILKHLENALRAVSKEMENYSMERLKTFAEGGSMSESELQQTKEQLEDIKQQSNNLFQTTQEKINGLKESHQQSVNKEEKEYQDFHAANVAELKFFASMQELFAQAKGRISTLISSSNLQQAQLDQVLSELEGLMGKTAMRQDSAKLYEMLSTDYESPETIKTASDLQVDVGQWKQDDAGLSQKLRSTKIVLEGFVKASRASQILSVLDDTRKQLYTRGLSLACLQYGCEFTNLSPDMFIEAKKEDAKDAVVSPTGGATGKQDASPAKSQKDKGQPAKGGKDKPPKSAEGDRGVEEPTWNRFLKVVRMELQAQRYLMPAKEQLLATAGQYLNQHPQLLRSQVLGPDLHGVTNTIQTRISEQETRFAQHVTAAIPKYREQVQRAHLVTHRVGQELFIGLYNLAVDSVQARLSDVFAVFNSYYKTIIQAKRSSNGVVKSNMMAPSNRPKLQNIAKDEAYRQEVSLTLARKYWGILAREIQEEALKLTTRACHTLTTLANFMRSFVTPDHLISGENVIVGRHKGLKRLLRQKIREEQAQQMEGTLASHEGGGKDKGKDKKDTKKAEPKKSAKDDKGKKGGKGGDTKDDDDQNLPLLEKPSQEISGTQLNTVKLLDDFKKANPNVQLKNHYLLPSQWDQEVKPVEPTVDAGKKPGAKAAKPTTKQQSQQHTNMPTEPQEATPVFSQPLIITRDRLHQQAVFARQQSIDAFTTLCNNFGEQIRLKFGSIESVENEWVQSWINAMANLGTDVVRPAALDSPPPPPQPQPPVPGKK